VVVLTIAIGIGANATVLGIIDTAFLRKLPVPNPERIVRVVCSDSTLAPRRGASRCSFPELLDLQERVRGLDGLAAYAMAYTKLGGELSGLEVYSAFVSGNYFSVLAVRPARGRFIEPDEAAGSNPQPVVVISDVLWRGTFGRDERIVGRSITIGASRFTIIGVAPAGFSGVHAEGRTDLWLPHTTQALATGRDDYGNREARAIWTPLIGRLSAGAFLAEVQGSLDNAARDLAASHPEGGSRVFRAELRGRLLSADARANAFSTFLIAWVMIALVHMVACSNVASLLLARARDRQRELGIRLCLGASRGRIVLQSLGEPILLAFAGAVGGLLISRWLTGLVTSMWFMSAMDRGLDARVIAIVAIVALATALLFGLMPAMASANRDPMDVLRSASPGMKGASPATLVVAQIALSFILLAQAMLLVGKYRHEDAVDLGYESSRLVATRVQLHAQRSTPAEWSALYESALSRAAAVPGVTHAAAADNAPLAFGGWYEEVAVSDREYAPDEQRQMSLAAVGPGYFSAIGARVMSGREFTAADRYEVVDKRRGAFNVTIVNESFARRYWPGRDPIGKTLKFRKGSATIVGVVRDMHDVLLSRVVPRVYFPLLEWSYPRFTIVSRVEGDPAVAAARLRKALVSLPLIDPPLVRTIDQLRADQLQVPRVLGLALSACAGVALLLTAIGLYGAVAMWAATRRTEIGIRLALGARAQHVYTLLLSGAGTFVAGGTLVGGLAAIALVRLEQSRYGPSLAFDPRGLAVALTVFGVVTTAAAWLPARRATKTAPAEVLRSSL
jgi:predicted permease